MRASWGLQHFGTLRPAFCAHTGQRGLTVNAGSTGYPYSDKLDLYAGLQTLPLPRLQRDAVPVVHHPLYSAPTLKTGHRFPMRVFQTIHDLLLSDGVIDARQVRTHLNGQTNLRRRLRLNVVATKQLQQLSALNCPFSLSAAAGTK